MNITILRRWGIFFLLSGVSFALRAQAPIISENFESYTTGARLCTQAPAYWYTWNNGPGTAEDPKVTDTLAFQGTKSLNISGTNDVLLNLSGKTSGRYEVSFYSWIPVGKVGFFGLLHEFDGAKSEWGLRCYFDLAKKLTVEAGGMSVDYSFSYNQWFKVRNVIDLDFDYAAMYVGENLILEWQWSKGITGVPGLKRLDAMNFFAWNADQRSPKMYLDSIVYKTIPAPDPPRSLTYVVNSGNVNLSWMAPANGTPIGYRVYRDSVIISPLITSLSYGDLSVYPGTYQYSVKAVYVSGMSQPAGPVQVTVPGGTARKNVLLEIGTGTWCTYCPGASMGAEDLEKNGQEVAVIEYHDNDPYSNPDADYRNFTYYNMPGLPTAFFDGVEEVIGGNATKTMYPTYLPKYNLRIPKLSLFTLDMGVEHGGANELNVAVTAKMIYPTEGTNLKLHLALTESHIPEVWQVIMTELNSVCRKMYPDFNGTIADFSGDSVVTVNYNVKIDTSYKFNNCELIAFLQDDLTKEVLQTEKVRLKSLGIEDPKGSTLSVFPNPASDKLVIKSDDPLLSLSILDMTGRTIINLKPGKETVQTDVSQFPEGLYLIYLRTAKGLMVRKISIIHG